VIMIFALLFLVESKPAFQNFTKPNLGFFWDTLKIGSWNIMGMPWLPFRELAISNIFTEDFDVLHLIEVWSPVDQQNIIELAKKNGYRYHYLPSIRNGPNGCDFSNPIVLGYAQFFVFCLVTQTLPGPINTQQLVQPFPYPMNFSCGEVAVGLSIGAGGAISPAAGQQCLSCLINAMQDFPNGESAFAAIEVCGAGLGKDYFNGGNNGQLILSKHKIKNVKESPLDAIISNRINIYATINNIRIGFGHFAYDILADYGIKDMQAGATQIDHAKDFVASGADVLIGDFNTGVDYQCEAYNYLLANGYTDLIQPQPVQTWCDKDHTNFHLCLISGLPGASIDHIMLKNSCRLSARKVHLFNQQPLMSDHVGVAATVSKLWFAKDKLNTKE